MTGPMLTAALEYGRRGWPVVPLHNTIEGGCSCSKGATCSAVAKHPRTKNGLKDASSDADQIAAWWERWPDANVAILTGAVSGLLVIDIDGQAGKDSFATLAAEIGNLPETLTASTGKGTHLFFKHPGNGIGNSAGLLGDCVDTRGEGGYVVGPPSLHANLNRYAWENPDVPLATLPDALLQRISKSKRPAERKGSREPNAFQNATSVNQGSRNDFLFKLGCKLRGQQGKEHSEILAILLEFNAAKCKPPLDESEVQTVVANICQHPAERGKRQSAKRHERNPLFWFQLNVRDFFSDENVMLMDDRQTGWWIRLMALSWNAGGFLPADRKLLWRLAKAKSQKVFDCDADLVLAEYEAVEIDGEAKLKHRRLATRYSDTLDLWTKKRQAGEFSNAVAVQLAGGQNVAATAPQVPTVQ